MKVPKRIALSIVNSLKGGVVPRVGLPYVAVGRDAQIDALIRDIDIIAEGGGAFRFIVGKYGAGKSFLLQTIRSYAMDRNFVVVDADLSPERRLQGGQGQGLATYRELVRNMSTRTRPSGGALTLILDRWISKVLGDLAVRGLEPGSTQFSRAVEGRIHTVVRNLSEMVHGYDFATLLVRYWHACESDDDELKAAVLKWFAGEYANKTEARAELGVRIVIGDDDWYDYLKLFASFLVQAGYAGMLVCIDELVNIYKIPNAISRQYNYEKILTMYNDILQGKARYIGVLMGCTPQALEDRRRGIYSYEALRSRLSAGRFCGIRYKDMLAPIISLEPLGHEELLVLVGKLADIHGGLFGWDPALSDDELARFIVTEFSRVGADTHITPREVIRDFIEMLDIVYQNPDVSFMGLIQTCTKTDEKKKEQSLERESAVNVAAVACARPRDDFATFTL